MCVWTESKVGVQGSHGAVKDIGVDSKSRFQCHTQLSFPHTRGMDGSDSFMENVRGTGKLTILKLES